MHLEYLDAASAALGIIKAKDADAARYAQPLSAMGTEPRLRIMRLLLSAHPNGMIVGVILGKLMPDSIDSLRRMEFGQGSQINIPIAVLIRLMIIPMMMKVDFASIRNVGKRPRGLAVTLLVNRGETPCSLFCKGRYLPGRHQYAPEGKHLPDTFLFL